MSGDLKILKNLKWLGHDSFLITSPLIIYIDPWRLPDDCPAADLLLVSHEHQDHCSPEDIEKVRGPDTKIVANPSASKKISAPVTVLSAGESIEYKRVIIQAVPAYNLDKSFHPKGAGHIGYILILDGERLYFAGDSDYIEEMDDIQCDIALLPVSGTYVMDAEEASRAVMAIGPRVAIPMHYGAGVAGTLEDAEKLRQLSSAEVVILEKETAV